MLMAMSLLELHIFGIKEDYDADEDGLEMVVNGDVIIFYQSDIKSIEVI